MRRKQGDVENSGTWSVRSSSWPSVEETSQVGLKGKGSPDQQGTILRKQEESAQVDFHLLLPALPFLSTAYSSSPTPAKDSSCPAATALRDGCLRAQSHAGVEHSHRGDKTLHPPLPFQLASPAVRVNSPDALTDWRLAPWDKYGPQSLPSQLDTGSAQVTASSIY